MFQEIAKVSAVVAAGMVGIASIGNAVGRIFWAWISDAITRRWTFVTMFLLQVGLFWILPSTSSAAILARPRVHHPHVLRRRVRHHAGVYRRLLRIEERRAHLRTDAHRMGFRECIRSIAHRTYAAKQRIVYKRSPCDCRHHGRIDGSANPGLAAQNCHCKGCEFKDRRFRGAFEVTYLEWIAARGTWDFETRRDSR